MMSHQPIHNNNDDLCIDVGDRRIEETIVVRRRSLTRACNVPNPPNGLLASDAMKPNGGMVRCWGSHRFPAAVAQRERPLERAAVSHGHASIVPARSTVCSASGEQSGGVGAGGGLFDMCFFLNCQRVVADGRGA